MKNSENDPFVVEVNRRRKLRANRQEIFSIFGLILGLGFTSQLPENYKLLFIPIFFVSTFIGPLLFPVKENEQEMQCPRCNDVPTSRDRLRFQQCANCFYPNPPSAYWKEHEAIEDVIGDQWQA